MTARPRKAKKSRFRVGQVVAVNNGEEFVQLIRKPGEPFIGQEAVYARGGKDQWYDIYELRPLTAREKGRSGK